MVKIEKLYGKMDMATYLEDYVNVSEFLEYCQACDSYGKNWSCPEYDFDALEYWKRFDYIHIYGSKIIFDAETIETDRTEEELTLFIENVLRVEKNNLSEILFDLEVRYSGSISLSAGSCHLCEPCTKLEKQPCKYPKKMRYSMESLGGNVAQACSKILGVELLWSKENKLPKYFVLVSALLAKDD